MVHWPKAPACSSLHRLSQRGRQPATWFDAVIHYDLAWNPTRHEQREGRVDRYGQLTPIVRVVTYYGLDNQIDGLVLDVLMRKHRAIRSSLGISVPVPTNTDQLMEAIVEGLLLRSKKTTTEHQPLLPFGDFEYEKESLFGEWQAAADREKRSRTVFAQETIKPDEVLPELQAVRSAIGSSAASRDSCATRFACMVWLFRARQRPDPN